MKAFFSLLATFVACAAALAAAPVLDQEMAFMPIDEGTKDAGWQAYKSRLLSTLETKNRKALLAAIDPNVSNGPEAKRGIAEFRHRWNFDQDKSPMWEELRKAVSL